MPPTLPALLKAQRSQEKAARVGFDWKDAKGPLAKIREELAGLEEAVAASDDTALDPHVKEELGDLLFAVVNAARHLGIDPERALNRASDKFISRFAAMERIRPEDWHDLSTDELLELWRQAKAQQRH